MDTVATTTPQTTAPARSPDVESILLPLFFGSGACGLIYEVVWSRHLVFVMGATTFAIATVLVAFMSGLALGAYIGGRVSHRIRRPAVVYGVLEICIGLYALLLPLLLGGAMPLYHWLYQFGESNFAMLTAVRFVVSTLYLLIPTTLMGATLPLVIQYLANREGSVGRPVALLYGINAFGAVCGTLGAGLILLPAIGFFFTTLVAAAINVTVGLVAILLLRESQEPATSTRETDAHRQLPPAAPDALAQPGDAVGLSYAWLLLIAYGISGFAAMVYQICWTRVLITLFGAHTYAFTCILGAFILGLAIGSMLMGKWVDRIRNPVLGFGLCEIGIALGGAVVVPAMALMPHVVRWIMLRLHGQFDILRLTEFVLVMVLVLVPTLLMGAIMPLITRSFARGVADAGRAIGRAYTANTVGTVIGSFFAGFLMIPAAHLGVQRSIVVAVVLNLVLGLILISASWRRRTAVLGLWVAGIVATAVSYPLLTRPWHTPDFVRANFRSDAAVTSDMQVEFYREGIDANVSVTRQDDFLTIRVNSKPDASNSIGDAPNMLLAGHLPVMMCRNPRQVMTLGLGAGLTLGAIACHPRVESIDSVEISDAVLEAAELFSDWTYDAQHNSRVNTIRADGRNHLLLTEKRYDVISSMPSNPWLAGVGNLFTREFFELCKSRLNPGGVLGIWLEAYAMSTEDFQMVIRTLDEVMPFVTIWEMAPNDYLFIASNEPQVRPLSYWQRRLETPWVKRDLARIGAYRLEHLLGRLLVDDTAVAQVVGDGPLNTDDNARLEFSAPAYVWTKIAAYSRTLSLLHDHSVSPFKHLVVADGPDEERDRLARAMDVLRRSRDLRRRGLVAAAAEDWREAIERLHEAYALAPTDPVTLETVLGGHKAIHDGVLPFVDPLLQEWIRAKERDLTDQRQQWRSQELPPVLAKSVGTLELSEEPPPDS
ncbi:MAG TPA: fused MFS/spermidine synthase [Phycisphaerae bacterium]|nr:fused MFS/spermidine synthase [Phycisphaerae bacterium]